ncbi:class I SAM-dependent methyltransferase [Chlorobium phaeobacteroides]|nr:class I SAM-dependent methyltransferase [Chlorobium phaeobacteroides]
MITGNPFETYAVDYDKWFETAAGANLFQLELDCLKKAVDTKKMRWLEVGVGSGRFACALGITTGADPAPAMVKIASSRGIETITAPAEALPFNDASFDGVLISCAICFVQNPTQALVECHRVLKEGGQLVIGFIPSDSRWGEYHAQRGKEGNPFYAAARFYSSAKLRRLTERNGFICNAGYGCMLPSPDAQLDNDGLHRKAGMDKGFMVLSFYKKNI